VELIYQLFENESDITDQLVAVFGEFVLEEGRAAIAYHVDMIPAYQVLGVCTIFHECVNNRTITIATTLF